MISKVFGGTIWFVVGMEMKPNAKTFDWAWLRSVQFPYYAGHGVSVSVLRRTLRIGVCTPLYKHVNLSSEDDIIMEVVGGRELENEPKEIGTWDSLGQEQTEDHIQN